MNGHERHSVVLHQPDWHLGVIGIVASRLVEQYYRPTIMLTTVNGQAMCFTADSTPASKAKKTTQATSLAALLRDYKFQTLTKTYP